MGPTPWTGAGASRNSSTCAISNTPGTATTPVITEATAASTTSVATPAPLVPALASARSRSPTMVNASRMALATTATKKPASSPSPPQGQGDESIFEVQDMQMERGWDFIKFNGATLNSASQLNGKAITEKAEFK